MQPNELKALLERTKLVAASPTQIQGVLPYPVGERRRGVLFCPTGLVKARVIENGYKWNERRPISQCGDQDYSIPRRNGVLVEIAVSDIKNHLKPKKVTVNGKRLMIDGKGYPHTEVIELMGEKYAHMIISRKAILAAWNEYAMLEAEREKKQAESDAKYNRLYEAQAALMGVSVKELRSDEFHKKHRYLNAKWDTAYEYKADGEYKKDKEGKRIGHEVGSVTITIERAEEILKLLGER